jgi:hypothetical protein
VPQNPYARLVDLPRCVDFRKLGYRGHPILHGGRFNRLPLRYQAED